MLGFKMYFLSGLGCRLYQHVYDLMLTFMIRIRDRHL